MAYQALNRDMKDICDIIYDWMKSISEDINENTVFDTLKCRVLTKPYPYKSKKKRLVKKWWDKHSEIRVYKNVKLEMKSEG